MCTEIKVPNKSHVVYELKFPAGEFYFGCTKCLKQRLGYHKNWKGDTALSKVIQEYGFENVSVHVITNSLSKVSARSVEADLIKEHYYDPCCLNQINPKGRSCKVSDKIRAKIKRLHKEGRYDNAYNNNATTLNT